MDLKAFLSMNLHLISHIYWERKEKFDLSEDTYSTWMLFAVESGGFRYRIGTETGIVGPHQLLYCPPGLTLYRELISPMGLHFIAFTLADHEMKEAEIPSFKSQPMDVARVSQNFKYLRKFHSSVDPDNLPLRQWIVSDLWRLSCYEWDLAFRQEEQVHLSKTDDELMKRAGEWLQRHAHTKFKMKDVSGMFGLSPVQFTRRFQAAYRMLPSEFVRSLRIRKASRLLLETDLPLDQIAERCGFDNGFYLSRVFSRCMGMSPSKYRFQNKL